MKKNEYALIRLHHEYQISINDILSKKYDQQYVDFFKILKKIDKLTYRFDLSIYWRIHFVFSIAQLKLVSIESNFYQRSRFIHLDSMFVENDIKWVKFYEIDFLINKREIARRRSKYLIRWKEYESAYNEWRNISKFENVMNLMKNYESIMRDIIFLFDRLILFFISQQKSSSTVSFIKRLKLSFASSKQKTIKKKISIDKSRLSKINQKIMISWKSFTTQSFTVSIEQKFVVVISLRKSYTNAFKIRSIDRSTRRWWSRSSSIEIYFHDKFRSDEYKFKNKRNFDIIKNFFIDTWYRYWHDYWSDENVADLFLLKQIVRSRNSYRRRRFRRNRNNLLLFY